MAMSTIGGAGRCLHVTGRSRRTPCTRSKGWVTRRGRTGTAKRLFFIGTRFWLSIVGKFKPLFESSKAFSAKIAYTLDGNSIFISRTEALTENPKSLTEIPEWLIGFPERLTVSPSPNKRKAACGRVSHLGDLVETFARKGWAAPCPRSRDGAMCQLFSLMKPRR